jgi:hypothetical protein
VIIIAEEQAGRIGKQNCIKTQSTFLLFPPFQQKKKIAGIAICYTENEYVAVNMVTSMCSINCSEFNIVQS